MGLMSKRVGEGALTDQIAEVLEGRDREEAKRIIKALAERYGVRLGGEGLSGTGGRRSKAKNEIRYESSLGLGASVDLDEFDERCDEVLGRGKHVEEDDE